VRGGPARRQYVSLSAGVVWEVNKGEKTTLRNFTYKPEGGDSTIWRGGHARGK